jgi:presenilin-like A22 family membrane protease
MLDDGEVEMKYKLSIFFIGALFVLVYGLALLVMGPFEAAGLSVFTNPNNPINLAYFIFTLIVFTAVSLLIVKFGGKRIVQVVILGAMCYLAFYVSLLLFALLFSDFWSLVFAVAAAAVLIILLVKYPEWYVIDIFGVVVGLSVIAMLGISLSIFLVIVLLIALAAYDALSVYGTKHMLDLADVVLDLKLPLVLVVPKVRSYSFIEQTSSLKEKLKD